MNNWRDERIAKILEDAGLSSVKWQSVSGIGKDGEWRCDIISNDFTDDELMTKIQLVEKRYGLTNINNYKPEWGEGAHLHFEVNLK